MTDWNAYYQSLENWIEEKYENINQVHSYFQYCLDQQERFFKSSTLALKKYEYEMQKFHSSSTNSRNNQTSFTQNRAHRYIIPHPLRRIVAECIDAVVILIFKLSLIYYIKNDSTLIDLAKHLGFNFLFGTPEYRTFRRAHGWIKTEFKNEFPMSRMERLLYIAQAGMDENSLDFDLLFVIDQLCRLIFAIFEAILISQSFFGSSPGGATFGKWLMNLKVVSCEEIIASPDTVQVYPGSDLGIFRALVRSLLKGANFLTFFSFMCMLLFQYHRCTYDIIAGTLVVQPVENDGSNGEQDQN